MTLTDYERSELKRAIMIDGWDEWTKLGLTRSQISDIADRLTSTGKFMLTAHGEIVGDDVALAIDDLKSNKANAHLFRRADEPADEPRKTVPDAIQSLSAKDRLRLANDQMFADLARQGRKP
ncbi:MAG: hypothetical protein KDJ47_05660 [Hyphomicrobiaceae bacterium]|nr:hypothetical protein [Hyphomicrobiaceae bacterium]